MAIEDPAAMASAQRARSLLSPLLNLSAERKALVLILVFTALRLWVGATTGLGVDEAYSLSIARALSLSYFDHPPLHQWIAHFSELVFGPGRLVRTPFIALFAGSTWAMFLLTRRLYGADAALWATLALNLAGFFSVAAGEWILPDGPLLFFLLLSAGTLARIVFVMPGETEARWTHWFTLGLWLGLAGLAKYQAGLFALGLATFLIATARGRATLRTPGPYLAAATTLAMLTPVLAWNATHHWASFAFQIARGGGGTDIKPQKALQAFLGEFALMLPWVSTPLILAAISAGRRPQRDLRSGLCLALALPPILLFTLLPMMGGQNLPHWSMPGWIFLFPLLGDTLARRATVKVWPRYWALGSFTALAILWAMASADAATGWLGRDFPKVFKVDPTRESMSWAQLKPELERRGLLGPGTTVVSLKWMEAGKIEQALGKAPPVRLLTRNARGYAFRDRSPPVGTDVLIIASQNTAEGELYKLAPYFRAATQEPSIFIGRGGPELEIVVYKGHDLLRPYVYAPIPR